MRDHRGATDAEKQALHDELVALAEALTASLEQTAERAKPVELDQQKFGRVSRVDAIQQQKMTQATRRRQRVRLQQVRAALAAWGEGRYGECRACEMPIASRRLTARPETPFCLACQAEMERR